MQPWKKLKNKADEDEVNMVKIQHPDDEIEIKPFN